jgi:hypothetical protein
MCVSSSVDSLTGDTYILRKSKKYKSAAKQQHLAKGKIEFESCHVLHQHFTKHEQIAHYA